MEPFGIRKLLPASGPPCRDSKVQGRRAESTGHPSGFRSHRTDGGRQIIEPKLKPIFDSDSFGYRPGRSAHQAVDLCRQRCGKRDWVLDLNLKGFFGSGDHHILLKAPQSLFQERWGMIYLRRWLEAPVQLPSGELQARI